MDNILKACVSSRGTVIASEQLEYSYLILSDHRVCLQGFFFIHCYDHLLEHVLRGNLEGLRSVAELTRLLLLANFDGQIVLFRESFAVEKPRIDHKLELALCKLCEK